MNENIVLEPAIECDAALIESSLTGDRDAFGQIVARYQSPICALAYSACGNVARSEDLAQEIFIITWRKLSSLREPSRFKAWLYGIARNRINNAFRQQNRNAVTAAQSLEDTEEQICPLDEPDERAISKEEETILWHVLSGMPEIYREPMVLFYRQNESIPQVANVLAISEEAVRQRLSRGRALLNERITKVIQSGLRRTGPADTFALTVIAALPILAAVTTAKGAVLGMATTESAASQAGGFVGLLKGLGFFAGLIAVPATLGTYFGHKLSQDSNALPQQRKAAAKFWRIFGCGIALFLFLPLLLTLCVTGFLSGDTRVQFLSVMTNWLGLSYPFVIGALIFWAWQRRRKPATAKSTPAAAQNEPIPQSAVTIRPLLPIRISRRLVLFLTIAAAGLLVFCYIDMRHNVARITAAEARDIIINETAPGSLRASISVSHYRSLFHESPETYRTFLVEVLKSGKPVSSYWVPVDDATVALLAQKNIPCPTYIEGRDFEVLGAPGRFLPFLAAFVLGIGAIYLIKRSRTARPLSRP